MAAPVNTVAAGGIAVIDVTATTPNFGAPVSEASPGMGVAVTKVTTYGVPVTFTTLLAAPAITLATFDGTSQNVVLSNGNLTATRDASATPSGARSTLLKTTGKYYFEVKAVNTHGFSDMAGILDSTATYANMVTSGQKCSTVGFGGGTPFTNNGSQPGIGTIAINDAVSFAIDLTARKVWFRKNANGWNNDVIGNQNPATGVGGFIIGAGSFAPAVGFGGSSTAANDSMTMNCGQSAYLFSVPSGFGNWS